MGLSRGVWFFHALQCPFGDAAQRAPRATVAAELVTRSTDAFEVYSVSCVYSVVLVCVVCMLVSLSVAVSH